TSSASGGGNSTPAGVGCLKKSNSKSMVPADGAGKVRALWKLVLLATFATLVVARPAALTSPETAAALLFFTVNEMVMALFSTRTAGSILSMVRIYGRNEATWRT